MRYIDIYRKTSGHFQLVAHDCIQTDNADVTRKAVLKSFTMADGSTMLYTSGNDSAEMSLCLECNESQIQAISEALHTGELYFTGMRAGGHFLPSPADNGYFPKYLSEDVPAYVGVLTENSSVRILETAAHADLFGLQIPLKLETSGGKLIEEHIPTAGLLPTGGISIGGTEIDYSDYRYHKGAFIRKSLIFTEKSSFFVSVSNYRKNCHIQLKKGIFPCPWDTSQGDYRAEIELDYGPNLFTLLFSRDITTTEFSENLKPVRFQFSVYRQGV